MTTITDLVNKITQQILNPLISLLFVVATVVFLWGIIEYVIAAQGDPNKLKQGRQAMIWGLVGMFVMFSAWGIVKIFCKFFNTC